MGFHKGRLMNHVRLRVSDLAASARFHRAALSALYRAAKAAPD